MRDQQPRYRFRDILGYTGVLLLLLSAAVMAFFAIEKQANQEMLRDQAEASAHSQAPMSDEK